MLLTLYSSLLYACSSLVAHLAAVAATRVLIAVSCLIVNKVKTRDGERYPGNKKSFKELCILHFVVHSDFFPQRCTKIHY